MYFTVDQIDATDTIEEDKKQGKIQKRNRQ